MSDIARHRTAPVPVILSGGFRPFFLAAAVWAAVVIPLWLILMSGRVSPLAGIAPLTWHMHETVYGFGAAVVAGFLLTAVPNWTGRLPLRGWPLAGLVALWALGRVAVLTPGWLGTIPASIADLAFPVVFLLVVAREIIAGSNWRNLPVTGALALLLTGNVLIHAGFELLGARLGVSTLLLLIGLVGGRITPSFTRNWLVKQRPDTPVPAPFDRVDQIGLALLCLGLLSWTIDPDSPVTPYAALAGGLGAAARLARWRGSATFAEPLLAVLHLGYGWLAIGLFLLGINGLRPVLPPSTALHALTVGAIGCMTLAVMTRATLGHTGRPLTAGPRTIVIYGLVNLAALLRLAAGLEPDVQMELLALSAAAWSGSFGLFAVFYGRALMTPRPSGPLVPPI